MSVAPHQTKPNRLGIFHLQRAVFSSVLLILTLAVLQASALEPVLFGPEFTFMPARGLRHKDIVNILRRHLVRGQPSGAEFTEHTKGYEDRLQFTSPNGWWLALYRDSGGWEFNTNPMTVEQFRQYSADIQDAVFMSAANAGYLPALWQGGGHINIDMTNFKKNPLLFRNFIVDLLNHNELFLGAFSYGAVNTDSHSLGNAQSIRLGIPGRRRLNYADLSGFLKPTLAYLDQLHVRGQLTYTKVLDQLGMLDLYGSAFTFKNYDDGRLEIRAVRPQTGLDVFIRQIDLFERRLKYLEKLKRPIPFEPRVAIARVDDEMLTPPLNPQAALRSFYIYVRESGLEWKDHRDYLWPQWRTGGDLETFESSPWFLRRESKAKSCASQLE